VVGEDFPQAHVDLLGSKDINLEGLERAAGRTFRWAGRYHKDINYRDTLDTQLNVFETFHPKLPATARNASHLFLGNIHPALQLEVLEQSQAKFVALDTMNLWINTTPEALRDVLRRVDALVINDSEVKDLTGEPNLVRGALRIRELGPRIVAVKKGEHGCLLFNEDSIFIAPAYPLIDVIDPTGAGDTFAGGFLGYLASQDSTDPETLRKAVIHGSVVASFTCESFGPARLASITRDDIEKRYAEFMRLTVF
jgi:sugar/nucleoside kinase (ribokinase family)